LDELATVLDDDAFIVCSYLLTSQIKDDVVHDRIYNGLLCYTCGATTRNDQLGNEEVGACH
jgi:hypothetical protein